MSEDSQNIADDPLSESVAVDPEQSKKPKFDRAIVEGPLSRAVWKIAWPTVLTNIIGGLQGLIDHILVGRLVGFRGNAAIGVSIQLWIVVIVFISSIFIGMSVLVSRFAGAGDEEKVNRTVYQAFLTAIFMSVGILAPIGYFAAPYLLDLVNTSPEVKAEALPFLRIMYVFSFGMLLFFMLGGALRSAGDARTPMILGITMTVLNLIFNLIFIPGLGPIPAFGTMGSAMGTTLASGLVSCYALYRLVRGGWVVSFPKGGYAPDWDVIKKLFKFGLPAGVQGIAMNVGGVLMLSFIGGLAQSAAAQAAYAVSYVQLLSHHLDLDGINGCGGRSCRAESRRRTTRPSECCSSYRCTVRDGWSGVHWSVLFLFPAAASGNIRFDRTRRGRDRDASASRARLLRHLHLGRSDIYRRASGNRRHKGTALHIDHFASDRSAFDRLHDQNVLGIGTNTHLARYTCRTHYTLCLKCNEIQSGKVAEYCRESRKDRCVITDRRHHHYHRHRHSPDNREHRRSNTNDALLLFRSPFPFPQILLSVFRPYITYNRFTFF